MKLFKLSTDVTDAATKKTGQLALAVIEADGHVVYWFQPDGLNMKKGTPLQRIRLTPNRVIGGVEKEYEIRTDLLMTNVEHKPSGFKGVCTSIILMDTGCCHLVISPTTTVADTGELVQDHDFSIQNCVGDKLSPMTEEEKTVEQKVRPSGPSVLNPSRVY